MPDFNGLLTASAINIGAVVAIITGLGVLWQKVVRPGYRKLKAGFHMLQRVTVAADRLLPFAEYQLKPNAGSSLADKINRIETNHALAEEHWRKLEAGQDDLAKLVETRHAEVTTRLASIESGKQG